ncbi:hypothetical protein B7463_g6194, partial [Scytalidium lignicola]
MSVSVLGVPDKDSIVTEQEVISLAAAAGLDLPSSGLGDWSVLLSGLNQCAKDVIALEDYYPKVNLNLYPRTDIHRPEGPEATDKGGWAWRAVATCTNPSSDLLKGKKVALKDNIALAGVQCTNGTGAVDWVPQVDATVAVRVMDAGGVILGKAACENNCFGAVSDTSVTGPVHNPYADGYSCGGSSSGCGRLVATGSVDVAIGADQGGSIRIPAAQCGLVGLKPTWGLVPYTGCISLEATIDHVGPMARTVSDCAAILEAIAGSDGIDDRQPYNMAHGSTKYSSEVAEHLSIVGDQPLKGIKVGILEEGFSDPLTDPNVAAACHSAIEKLSSLGAEVKPISIPLHREGGMIWMVSLPMAGTSQGLLASPTGRRQLLFPERATAVGPRLSQKAFDALGPGGQNVYLRSLFLQSRYGSPLHARCTNLLRKLNDEYERVFRNEVDLLVTPTCLFPPVQICPEGGRTLGVLKMLGRTVGMTYNTATFNSSGHPALSLPVGFVPATDVKQESVDEAKEKVWLPTGLQIIGRKFEDGLCLKVAASWEKAFDWKGLKYE